MKTRTVFAAMLIAAASAGGAAAQGQGVLGLWLTPVRQGLVRLEPCGKALCGFVAGSPMLTAHPDQQDLHNKDPALRSRPIKGLKMLEVRPEGPGRWGSGWVYDPDNGATYKASLQETAEGRLKITGCVAGFLCQSQLWTRAGVPSS
ncbi:MAG TPA: DUF2147 domain-containing protein [Caulobacteraceae bacterium]|nr:DUF2147 domain-containing protein [Caulobacteraceae bacterium]